jgi:hypothetical protein
MVWLTRGESASSVRHTYDKRIDHFVRRHDGPRGSFVGGEEPLDRLFGWVEGVLRDQATLEVTESQQAATIRRQESDINHLNQTLSRLRTDLSKSNSDCQDLTARNKTLQQNQLNETTRLTSEHARTMRDTVDRYNHTTYTLKQEHSSTIRTLKANYEAITQKLDKDHRASTTSLKKDHQKEISKKDKEIDDLVGQLMVNQDEDRAWADNKLKRQFLDVQRLVDTITSPNNKELNLPKDKTPGHELDPTDFMTRAQRGKFHFLLKSKTWEILREQFFSAPFGFGAFGVGGAQRDILDVYFPWQKIFDSDSGSGTEIICERSRQHG